MTIRRVLATTLAFIAVLFGSCEHGDVVPPDEYSEPLARAVTEVTGGVISPSEPIRVRFSRPVAAESVVGTRAQASIRLSPRTRGETIWEDTSTLAFLPKGELAARTRFTAKLDLSEVEEIEAGGLDTEVLTFEFATAGREIVGVHGGFESEDDSDPSVVRYQGTVRFSEAIDAEHVERALRFSLDARRVELTIRREAPTEFAYATPLLDRGNDRRDFTLSIDAGIAGLSRDFVQGGFLESVHRFSPVEVVGLSDSARPSLRVDFTDEVDRNQQLEGLIWVEPAIELDLRRSGKSVYLHGEFEQGETYTVRVSKGVRSKWGTKTEREVAGDVTVDDMKPEIAFLQGGVFLPTTGNRRVHFRTINVRQVRVEVKKVFENNLGQFLQTEQLSSAADRNQAFNERYVNRVGVTVAEETLDIGETRNRSLVHELDLARLIPAREKGLFLVSLQFDQEDMLYDLGDGDSNRRYFGEDYYSDPRSRGYIWAHGRIYKPLVVTDIGLVWKQGRESAEVFATDLITARPLTGVDVTLRTYQNQIIAQETTDANGRAEFPEVDQDVFYLTGEKNGQRAMIKANEMAWNTSSFNVGGVSPSQEGLRAYIYAERGVHRPGDTIHLSAIFRNERETFPDDHPVEVEVTNARGQTHLETVVSNGREGFYYIPIGTSEDDPTGNWQVELTAGSSSFTHTLRVETIVPNRLKVEIEPASESLGPRDRFLTLDIVSSYLFGAPASGLDAEVDATIVTKEKEVAEFPGFTFLDQAVEFTEQEASLFRGTLSREGETRVRWELPSPRRAPSALAVRVEARVLEPGGKPTRAERSIPWDPYTHYIGLSKPDFRYGYAPIGSMSEIPVIAVDTDGNAAAGRQIEYRVYRNNRYWWWEYDSYSSFRARYRSDNDTELIDQGTIRSRSTPATIRLRPESWGEYLIEATDVRSGHTASFFFRASSWAGSAGGGDQGILALRTDRERYAPGDIARITAPSPEVGAFLVTVESGGEVRSSRWVDPEAGETEISVRVTDRMIPNAYVSVALFQPHAQTANDRPIRMYGVVPLSVEDPRTRQEVEILAPEVLEPREEFTVTVDTSAGPGNQVTIAVVDEGLLDLTAFETPRPWDHFYAKQRLGVQSYDLFSQVIGAFRGDVFRVFSIGGGEGATAPEPEGDQTQRRFEPVALFAGPLVTDSDGRVQADFTMPNYMGSVRIMAVAADGGTYGSDETAVPVRSEVVVLPTVPRVLGPNESFVLPVNLFSTAGEPGSVEVEITTEGPVQVNDRPIRQVFLSAGESTEVSFNVDTVAAVGQATITITVRSRNKTVELPTHIRVRASSPPIYRTEEETITPAESISVEVPQDGVAGSNRATLTVSTKQNVGLEHRMRWLLNYPYGCIEQTVSAAFPQLYIEMFPTSESLTAETTANINAAIERLRKFQLPSGAFSYWPGGSAPSIWGTSYAGHFLLEAKGRGYHVPEDLYSRWLRYERSRAMTEQDSMTARVYRLYLLAQAGEPAIGPMNLIRENNLQDMSDLQRWMLAAAYSAAGMRSTSRRILFGVGTRVDEYREFGGTYGSALRDTAMILHAATLTENSREADALFDEVSSAIGSDEWYSTQETGYALLAMGAYLEELGATGSTRIAGRYVFPDERVVEFDSTSGSFALNISDSVYQYSEGGAFDVSSPRVQVDLYDESTVSRAFVTLQWEGVPLFWTDEEIENNLTIDVSWHDENGTSLDPRYLTQGQEFYGRFSVSRTSSIRREIAEVYLDQIVPSGWEIVNPRLWGEGLPSWTNRWGQEDAEYLDIRDDRVSWFFDMSRNRNRYDFFMKFQAVYEGSFMLPPTAAGAMYDNEYRAVTRGDRVSVEPRF